MPRASGPRTPAFRRTARAASGLLPFPRTRELLDLANDQIALDPAQPIDEQHAVEVIHFVLERPREQSGSLVPMLSSRAVQPLDHHPGRADDRGVESRN